MATIIMNMHVYAYYRHTIYACVCMSGRIGKVVASHGEVERSIHG